jgi:hypothetical protein
MTPAAVALNTILVVIPALNEAATIGDMVRSLQTVGLFRICIVDNGSGDRTMVRSPAQPGPREWLNRSRAWCQWRLLFLLLEFSPWWVTLFWAMSCITPAVFRPGLESSQW